MHCSTVKLGGVFLRVIFMRVEEMLERAYQTRNVSRNGAKKRAENEDLFSSALIAHTTCTQWEQMAQKALPRILGEWELLRLI